MCRTMNYPKYNHYLTFRRAGPDAYHVKNHLTEEEWKLSVCDARFLKSLDGKSDPYREYKCKFSAKEIDDLLYGFEEAGLLDDAALITTLGIGSVILPLWKPKIKKIHRLAGAIWNRILMIVWLPLLLLGTYICFSGGWEIVETDYGMFGGYFFGFWTGLLLHELSHVFACIGYSSKNHFFELGIMLHYFIPGAYVALDYSAMKDCFKKAQINAAGIECNLALSGMFLCILRFELFDSSALIIAALINLILGVFNLSLIDGVDGFGVFMEIFSGDEELLENAKRLVLSRKRKRQLRKKGINGKATIAACYILIGMQFLLPLVLFMEVMNIVGMFI